MTTGEIRDEIWKRQGGICARCPNYVTKKTAHMHEKLTRGKGGKISLENSEILCAYCHILDEFSAHKNRLPKFTKRRDRA